MVFNRFGTSFCGILLLIVWICIVYLGLFMMCILVVVYVLFSIWDSRV